MHPRERRERFIGHCVPPRPDDWPATTAPAIFALAAGRRGFREAVSRTEGRVTVTYGLLTSAALLGLPFNALGG
jgi:hypothetical protein